MILVDDWTALRYAIIGMYVGVAVILGFVWWYLYFEDGPLLSWDELVSFESCEENSKRHYSCDIFKAGPDGNLRYPSTIALSILVTIEMLNALNSLSEAESLLSVPPWSNYWLLLAIMLSFGLHCLILYVPSLARIFGVAPLSRNEWFAVFAFSVPVVLLDEVVKWAMRHTRIREKVLSCRSSYEYRRIPGSPVRKQSDLDLHEPLGQRGSLKLV